MAATAAKMKKDVLDPSAEFLASLPEKFNDLGQAFESKVEATRQAFDDSVKLTKRTLKKVRQAAGQISDDAIHTVKKHPIQAVVITFGAAVAVGLIGGMLMRRPGKTRFGRLFA
jgi:ElaB/YqjD/DUF883 family membrane-anchored ribosome-binding protein